MPFQLVPLENCAAYFSSLNMTNFEDNKELLKFNEEVLLL
jgi:hypothetical protein